MNSIITTSAVTQLHADSPDSVRTVEVVTDGRVDSQWEATNQAAHLFGCAAFLSFRKSSHGELRFYFTDRQL